MGTRFLMCKDNVLRPNQKWTVGNKTKVSYIQVSKVGLIISIIVLTQKELKSDIPHQMSWIFTPS